VNVDGVSYNVVVAPAGPVVVSPDAGASRAPSSSGASSPSPASSGANLIAAPVAGTIIRYAVNEGSQVKSGDTVIIMESMKMELEIKAAAAGSVHFLAAAGTQVASQQPIAELR
jgi:oxaloacetate decarboxylase alpha subunit